MDSSFTLVLKKDDEVIFSSDDHGLRPLVECISKYQGKIDGCILYDIVVGIAAARLISFSKIADEVNTDLISEKALKHLQEHNIKVNVKETVEIILNKDKTDQCPMEKMSNGLEGDEEFFLAILERFKAV